MKGPFTAKGIAFIACEWSLCLIQFLVVLTRLYSRAFLTRSLGSDDIVMALVSCLICVTAVMDLEGLFNGWAQHVGDITVGQYSSEQKWQYICYTLMYIELFLIRASIMLFVLRLLPSFKVIQRRIVYGVFLINFVITLFACLSFGLSCRPMKANWDAIPNAHCFSKELLVITNQVNAALSCACDIVVAIVPQFLLWKVQMAPRTKRVLKIIFSLGPVTASLSIGRAAVTTYKALTEDTTWNMIPSYYISAFEFEFGIILASCPMLRQMIAYRRRTKSFLPTKERQYPNEDFEKTRVRVAQRDIMRSNNPSLRDNEVIGNAVALTGASDSPSGLALNDREEVRQSALDLWHRRIKNLFSVGGASQEQWPFGRASDASSNQLARQQSLPNASSDEASQERSHSSEGYKIPASP
ncbi:MAG: hypothetical protein M1820_008202 [Bogoriella megaspora]|nr:MAG: hypothetical protein M1820_008202 [Bogoriella megaspora]